MHNFKYKTQKVIMTMALIGLCLVANPVPVTADIFVSRPGIDCSSNPSNSAGNSTICKEHQTSANPLTGCSVNTSDTSGCGTGILYKITNIIAYLAGGAAIILIIIGAIRYVTSGSDVSVGSRIDDDVLNAKRTIVGALIGLAIIVLARTIIIYAISKLG